MERTTSDEPEEDASYEVVEHKHIEVAPTHLEVTEAEPAADEAMPYGARRYFAFVAGRRANRFLAASLAMAALTIVAGVWFLLGAAGVSRVQSLDPAMVAGGGVAILVAGFLFAWLTHRGNLAGLSLAWVAGLVSVAVSVGMLSTIQAYPAGVGEALLAAMGILGLAVLVESTLGLASWRGARTQRRILGGTAV